MHISPAAPIFWICLAIPAYVYFGYPALLASGFLARRKPVYRQRIQPMVSIIVAAHNEESVIEGKIKNLLALTYPQDRFEILIGNDGSTDRTAEIAARYTTQRVQVITSEVRRGKSSIQNEAVMAASGEILVFTDADCLVSPDTLQHAVDNFADPNVGLVTGTAAFSNSSETGVSRNENLYSRYEAWIRRQESDRGLLAAASGSFFAIRRQLWQPLEANVGDDFVLPLQVALRGKRNLLASDVLAWTSLPVHADSMFKVKKRIVSKDFRGLLRNQAVLNPLRTGAVAFGLWSHKLLRWLVAYFLCGLLLANLWLLHSTFFRITLAAQILFYLVAVIALARRNPNIKLPWSVILSFCVVNGAAMAGVFDCLTNRSFAQWKPIRSPLPAYKR